MNDRPDPLEDAAMTSKTASAAMRGSESDQSCRGILQELDRRGQLLVISEEIDPIHDVSAILSIVDEKAAVRLDRIKGHDMPIFGNILSDLDRVALALGVAKSEIQEKLLSSIASPMPPVFVDDAPVQQQLFQDDILTRLPVPTFFSKETGPYITAGLIVARDPETGLGNASYARIKMLGPNEAMIGIAPNHHLAIMARKAGAKGEPLPFAVVLGAHPAIQLAACFYLGLGDDEMHCAGSLLGEPVRLARCKSIDLAVPAEAEIVLEGHIHIDEPILEGLVSEYHGMYEDYGSGVRVRFECMTCRSDAMLQVIEPGYHMEHLYLGAVPIAASLKAVIRRSVLNVGEVAVTASGSGRNNVVVQIDAPRPGQARRIMSICWGAVSIVKNITIVDSDVDPWDLGAVELAKMTRMRAERDILIVTDLPADRSEPQEHGGVIAKVGYDATMKAGDRREGFDKALPPPDSYERMRQLLSRVKPEILV
ncbi:UbiD family decarboxylase [Rhizobium leguminosarum]|uniref:UbiD family decarboxylase n=1 Tax=Rhizobium leguminosarum TaxID=384 RepID=UPI0010321562|nr:UbiD family decarboxylase [Rhizobium leguminosarum]TAX62000.1 UbiD family decarboxylase [Rhizobium leguminosarum]TAY03528.1 UbiD family decarboxylase [Rhizobium leguminosarum]TAY18976.1 UbiD family decarboxylase [Rhizobium leguminosarum]